MLLVLFLKLFLGLAFKSPIVLVLSFITCNLAFNSPGVGMAGAASGSGAGAVEPDWMRHMRQSCWEAVDQALVKSIIDECCEEATIEERWRKHRMIFEENYHVGGSRPGRRSAYMAWSKQTFYPHPHARDCLRYWLEYGVPETTTTADRARRNAGEPRQPSVAPYATEPSAASGQRRPLPPPPPQQCCCGFAASAPAPAEVNDQGVNITRVLDEPKTTPMRMARRGEASVFVAVMSASACPDTGDYPSRASSFLPRPCCARC